WTCMSISPGQTILPVASRTRSACAEGWGPTPRTLSPRTHRSVTWSRPWEGSMTRPLVMRRVIMARIVPARQAEKRPRSAGLAGRPQVREPVGRSERPAEQRGDEEGQRQRGGDDQPRRLLAVVAQQKADAPQRPEQRRPQKPQARPQP